MDPTPIPMAWQSQLLTFALTTMAAIVTAAVPLVARWAARKYKLEGEAQIEAQLQQLAELGIAYAQEQAHKATSKMSGSAKLDAAMAFVVGQVQERHLPERSAEAIKAMIEAKLPSVRDTLPPPSAA